MTKFKQAVQDMIAQHPEEFREFGKIHDLYKKDQSKWQIEFDRVGKPVQRILEQTESWLCSKMESGGKGKFSSTLADKFKSEVRAIYPLVDFIGVTVS